MIFESGSGPPNGARAPLPADLNEGADPHYPFKDMLIGAAFTDPGLSQPETPKQCSCETHSGQVRKAHRDSEIRINK